MIAVDTNILVYADREESALHAEALQAVRRLAEGDEAWAIPVFCVGEFLRVVSHDRLFDPPTPVMEAMDSVDSLLASPSSRLLAPGDRYLPLLRQLIAESHVQGNLVYDAQIAAAESSGSKASMSRRSTRSSTVAAHSSRAQNPTAASGSDVPAISRGGAASALGAMTAGARLPKIATRPAAARAASGSLKPAAWAAAVVAASTSFSGDAAEAHAGG